MSSATNINNEIMADMNFDNLYRLLDGINREIGLGLFEFNSKSGKWKEISAKKVLTIYIPHLNDTSKYRAMHVNTRLTFVLGLDKVKERFAEILDAVSKNKIIQAKWGNTWIDEKDSKQVFSGSIAYVTGKYVRIKSDEVNKNSNTDLT